MATVVPISGSVWSQTGVYATFDRWLTEIKYWVEDSHITSEIEGVSKFCTLEEGTSKITLEEAFTSRISKVLEVSSIIS